MVVEDVSKDISFYINLLGGLISVGMVIYDIMVLVFCDIVIYVMGMVVLMGEFLLVVGIKGKCYVLLYVCILMY